MKIKDIALSAAYVGQRVVKAICVGAQEVWSAVKYIVFADHVVEQICATNWGDGTGITEEQAAEVTDIGTIFQGNTEITEFTELNKFGVTELKDNAFNGCTNLSIIDLSNIQVLNSSAFNSCENLVMDVSCPNLRSISDNSVFKNTKIVKISNLGTITKLSGRRYNAENLFFGCTNLRAVVLPSTLTALTGDSLFNGCSLLSDINLGNITEIGARSFANCGGLEIDLNYDALKTIGNEAFASSGVKSIKCPNVTSIGSAAFRASKLTGELSFPNLEGYIDKEAFEETEIDTINNLGNITEIRGGAWGGAFHRCSKLKKAIIPSTVTNIGDWVFHGCSNLQQVIINASVPPTLGSGVYTSTPSTMSIYVPDQSVQAYREASGWIDYANRILPIAFMTNIVDNYIVSQGQSYGSVGSKVNIEYSESYQHVKVPIQDIRYARVQATGSSIPSSLIQYVNDDDIILKLDATDNPKTLTAYDIEMVEGATHVYISSATGTIHIHA